MPESRTESLRMGESEVRDRGSQPMTYDQSPFYFSIFPLSLWLKRSSRYCSVSQQSMVISLVVHGANWEYWSSRGSRWKLELYDIKFLPRGVAFSFYLLTKSLDHNNEHLVQTFVIYRCLVSLTISVKSPRSSRRWLI